MRILSLYLRNFRNIEESYAEFGPGLNVLSGSNAQGKTNILEALSLVSTGRSFRTVHINELVKEGASFFFLEASFIRDQIRETVRLQYDGKNKSLQWNASTFSSFQPLLGALPAIFYMPLDLDLIQGSPSSRRRFLNLHLAQGDPLYMHHLTRFWRSLRQRNYLLREKTEKGIGCWEREMALSAAYISQTRKDFLKKLEPLLKKSCQMLSSEVIVLRFTPSSLCFDTYLNQLKTLRPKERILGFTSIGPHREEIGFSFGGKALKTYASEGQKRTAIAALRLAEWEHLSQSLKDFALFAIDDFELHLDPSRQVLLQNALNQLGQVFLTTPNPNPVCLEKTPASLFKVKEGTLVNIAANLAL